MGQIRPSPQSLQVFTCSGFSIGELGPFPLSATYLGMEQARQRLAIEAKLARCRELQRMVNSDFTTAHLREVAAERQAELYRLIRKAHDRRRADL